MATQRVYLDLLGVTVVCMFNLGAKCDLGSLVRHFPHWYTIENHWCKGHFTYDNFVYESVAMLDILAVCIELIIYLNSKLCLYSRSVPYSIPI